MLCLLTSDIPQRIKVRVRYHKLRKMILKDLTDFDSDNDR